MDDKVRSFALNHGYDNIRKSIKWNGYNVYEPFFYGSDDLFGYSIFILASGNTVRLTTRQESNILCSLIKHH